MKQEYINVLNDANEQVNMVKMDNYNKQAKEEAKTLFGDDGDDVMKAAYLRGNLDYEVDIPSRVVKRCMAHKMECSAICYTTFGDKILTGGADNLVKEWDT
jgi:hypothetical protein